LFPEVAPLQKVSCTAISIKVGRVNGELDRVQEPLEWMSMMIKKTVAALVLLSALCGCAPSKHFVNKNYRIEELKQKVIYVEPVKKDWIRLEIVEHFKDDFQPKDGADYQQILADTLNKRMLSPFKHLKGENVFENGPLELTDSDYFEIEKYLHSGTKNEIAFRFRIPNHSALTRNSIQADFCLVTKDYVFDTQTIEVAAMSSSIGSSSNRHIKLDLKYVMWDYKRNDVVSYGVAIGSENANYFVTKGDWLSIMEKPFESILVRSPFRRLIPAKNPSSP
jgi:hypothetical protein